MNTWQKNHQHYSKQDWINLPSIFAEQAINYFPKNGKLLELGAGQAQDSRFFVQNGFEVTATDLEDSALELAKQKSIDNKIDIKLEKIDLRDELPYESASFDVVYAHLSLHYFDHETTTRLINEIDRVLKPGGVFAFLVNSTNDPEYGQGKKIEPDYCQIDDSLKRYFSEETARQYTKHFDINLLDELGETYKDTAKGVHNLVRFIGTKPKRKPTYRFAIPFVGAIIERENNGTKEVLLQTRYKPNGDPLYSGTIEFPAGTLDKPYENIYETLRREIFEETGLRLKSIKDVSKTKSFSPNSTDEIFGFRPFCCTQQLRDGKPWIGFIFICEVEEGEPVAQPNETRNPKWVPVSDIKEMFNHNPEKLFGLELPAWEYYLNERI